MAQINAQSPVDFPESKEVAIINFIDKLMILFPNYQDFMVDTFINQLEDKRAKRIDFEIEAVLKQMNYITNIRSSSRVSMTDLGRTVKQAGGHFNFLKAIEQEQEWIKKREKLEIDNLETTISQNRHLYNTRWHTYILSVIAIVISIIALFKDCNLVPQPNASKTVETVDKSEHD
ncbi:hypothetical protein ACLI09_04615 [Flavobacterium sp. RHBU_24]|uniref:hypothetical protein n=1 Tax=Flavobacterium sp. RHBU_24 TaxID=3391185 RepID=UPI003984930A